MKEKRLVIIRGGGDLATGAVQALQHSGFSCLILEAECPAAIRRQIALSETVYDGQKKVEDVEAQLCHVLGDVQAVLDAGKVAVLVDPQGTAIEQLRPWAVVDAILAKRNLGTTRSMAPKTIALGPGFAAGADVDIVIETKRGHNLGRMITTGTAAANTGVPGIIGGYGAERVMHSPATGYWQSCSKIGDLVEKGSILARLTATPDAASRECATVQATLTGLLRGMIRDGYHVEKGLKVADIDPRKAELKNCFTISDKARSIGNAVVTALLYLDQNGGDRKNG